MPLSGGVAGFNRGLDVEAGGGLRGLGQAPDFRIMFAQMRRAPG